MSKSRRKKHFTPAKQERKKENFTPIPERTQVTSLSESVSSQKVAQPSVAPPIRYPYIATELRTIGIIAGIMLLILVVLSFVLT